MTLTDVDTAQIAQLDSSVAHSARVARTNIGTIHVVENDDYEPPIRRIPTGTASRVGRGDYPRQRIGVRIGVGIFRKFATALRARYPYSPGDDCTTRRNNLNAKFAIIIRIALGIVKY